MYTNDVNFYTVKQIDDYLQTDECLYRCSLLEKWGFTPTCEAGGHPWFALEHARNRLIDRLKTRLAIANGMGHSIKGEKRAEVLMDLGFANYKKVINMTIGDGCSRKVQNPPKEIEENFRKFAGDILDNVKGVKTAKFVFCDESIEFKFTTEDEITFAFELFYDTNTSFICSSYMDAKAFFAAELNAYDIKPSLKYIEDTTSELVARKLYGLIG